MKLDRNRGLKIAGVILLLSSILFVYISFSKPVYNENTVRKGYYTIESKFNFSAEMAPNMIYGKQKIDYGEGIFFQKLVNSIDVIYSLTAKTDSNGNISGTYRINAYLVSGKSTAPYWEKKIPVYISGNISSDIEERIKLNLDEIYGIFQNLENEAGIKGGRQILLVTEMNLNGVAGGEKFSKSVVHKTTISLDRMITVQNPRLEEKKVISETHVSENRLLIMGLNPTVKIIRYVSSIIFFAGVLMAGIPTGYDYLSRREKTGLTKKRGVWIIQASYAGFEIPGNHVDVSSMEELIRLSYEFDRPLIDTGKEYYVIDGSVVFRFGKSL